MNHSMAMQFGRCGNELYCSVASAGDIVSLHAGDAFLCPKCGKALIQAAPGAPAAAPARWANAALLGAGAGLGALAVGAGLLMWSRNGTQAPAPAPRVQTLVPKADAVPAIGVPPMRAPAAPPVVQPAPAPVRAAPASPARVAPVIAPPPARGVAPAGIAPARPVIAAPPHAVPAPPVTRPPPPPQVQRGTPPLKPPAAPVAARPAPTPPAPTPPAPTASAVIRQAPAPRAAPPAPVTPAAVAPAPAPALPQGENRPFRAVPIAGGEPDYPQEYADEARAGAVTISCTIQTTGIPSGCHVVSVEGGNGFSRAVLRWIGTGQVRYAPVLRNGQAVAEPHQWVVHFKP